MKKTILEFLFVILLIGSSLHGHGFGPYTLIKTEKSWKSIEQICKSVGKNKLEYVASYRDDSQDYCNVKCVKAVGEGETNCYYRIKLNEDANNDILCTPSQAFYVVRENKWVFACELKKGDTLLAQYNNVVEIFDIEFIEESLNVYSLEVNDTHNFFVGYYSVLAHNIMFPAVIFGISGSFGAGAAAGGTAGSFFGPITLCGGIIIGGIVGVLANYIVGSKSKAHQYQVAYDKTKIDIHLNEANIENKEPTGSRPSKERKASKKRATVEDILRDAKPGEKKRRVTQYVKPGGYIEAEKDFDRLIPKNVVPIKDGKRGILADGRDVNVRRRSVEQKVTLEIYNRNIDKSIKIRYIKQ